jgi:hypothetical protein
MRSERKSKKLGLKHRFLRRCKGYPSARCHPCSSRTTLRRSGGRPDIPYVLRARIEACPHRRKITAAQSTGSTAGRSPYQVVQFGFGPARRQCPTDAEGTGGRRNQSGGSSRLGRSALACHASRVARRAGCLRRPQPGLPAAGENGTCGLAFDRAADRPTRSGDCKSAPPRVASSIKLPMLPSNTKAASLRSSIVVWYCAYVHQRSPLARSRGEVPASRNAYRSSAGGA